MSSVEQTTVFCDLFREMVMPIVQIHIYVYIRLFVQNYAVNVNKYSKEFPIYYFLFFGFMSNKAT